MKEQTLNREFKLYYSRLSKAQKESMLSMMKSFLDETAGKSKRISVAQYNKELEEAEERINNGQFITQESLREEAKGW
jgi:L-lactate utilization protein LutC